MSFVLLQRAPEVLLSVMTEEEETAAAAALEAEVSRRVAAELEACRAGAEAEGRVAGEEAVRRLAAAEQQRRDLAMQSAIAAFTTAAAELVAPLAAKEQALAGLVTELAFGLACHLLRQEVAQRPDSLRQLVADLLIEAAAERHGGQSIIVRLNPEDHAIIAAQFAQQPQVHLLADAQILRGGTLVELLSASGDPIDKVEWDARLGSRMEVLRLALLGDRSEAPPA